MDEDKKKLYFDLQKHERDSVIGYLLSSLLQARKDCHIPSNEKTFDEDVNIYLAHLLFASSLPDYQELISRYLTLNSSDLMESIDQHPDKVVRYFIYKVNADYLLVHLGIFHDLVPAAAAHPFRKSERQFIEMGQSYYDYASQYNHQIYRKHTAVGDVLLKLARHFEDYKKILQTLREDFFHLIKDIKIEAATNGSHSSAVENVIKSLELEHKQNEFLDVYVEWLKTKSDALVGKLTMLAEEIKRLDPSFGFNAKSVISSGDIEPGKKEDIK